MISHPTISFLCYFYHQIVVTHFYIDNECGNVNEGKTEFNYCRILSTEFHKGGVVRLTVKYITFMHSHMMFFPLFEVFAAPQEPPPPGFAPGFISSPAKGNA